MENELLTIDEVAKLLKVHRSHVFRLMKEGELTVVKRGRRYTRILRSDLMAFIQKHRKEAIPREEV
ncbi:MAG: helix-turn-helix domain-containing protein [Chloroflexi bacterium]|nr:helix-turn-helix domain-containing protein [Chloroflexota bacterium]